MEKIHLKKENGGTIPTLWEVPDGADTIVVMIHGFESRKECDTGKLLFRRMPPEGIGVVTYDQPGHGAEEAREDPLRIESCKDSLARVEQEVSRRYPDADIVYFASSYGAYMTALYVSTRPHRGRKLFMRSAAVNMPRLFLGEPGDPPDEAALALLEKQGWIAPNLGIGEPVRVPKAMFEDLRDNDLFEKFDPDAFGETACRMVHGGEDAVVNVAYARAFSEKFGVPLTVLPGEPHSIDAKAGSTDKVADLAIAFFRDLPGSRETDGRAGGITFRAAREEDIDAAARLYDSAAAAEEAGHTHTGWERGVYPTRKTAEDAVSRGDLFVAADPDGRIVASAILNKTQVDVYEGAPWAYPAADDQVMVIHTLVVDPALFGRGIGTAFIRYYEQTARERGCTVLRLDTNEKNQGARALYRRLGYREADIRPCVFNGIPGVRLVLLEKRSGI